MAKRLNPKARGILNPVVGAQHFQLALYEPITELRAFVEHYWSVKWELRGQAPYRSETLPFPNIHLTVEPDGAFVVGVVTRKFSRLLQGEGWVFGIKFKAGGFYPFVQRPVSDFTDQMIPLYKLLGKAAVAYDADIRALSSDEERVAYAEVFLCQFAPAADENCLLVNQIVEVIGAERSITKVDNLVERFALNKRSLQRLFNQYVGVSPKWVIQRFRLHEAIDQVGAGEVVEWSKLAVELGYFDQAHFIKDFKAMVGLTPVEYAKGLAKPVPLSEAE